MERRSPYTHNQNHRVEINHRYAGPLPPPPPLPPHLRPRDRDRDFRHPHHDRLPLPPPPPLPPPYYRRILFDDDRHRHHNNLNARFIEQHHPPLAPPRFREPPPPPEFHRVIRDPPPPPPPPRVLIHHPPPSPSRDYDRDMWDPPRVSLERHHPPIRRDFDPPPPRPSMSPYRDSHRQLYPSPNPDPNPNPRPSMSPYRDSIPRPSTSPRRKDTSLHELSRFNEVVDVVDMDIDSDNEDCVVVSNRNGSNTSTSASANRSQGFLFGKQKEEFRWGKNGNNTNFDFGRSVSPSNTSTATFTFGKGRVFGNGEEPVVETIEWGTAEKDKNKKRKLKNLVKREESPTPQLFVHSPSPKPEVPRTSVLLRVGKTPNKWKDDVDENFPSDCFKDSNAGSSNVIADVNNVGRSVELDVTFKSNALVAKPIIPPPNEVGGSDGMGTPDNKKNRKIVAPVFGLSSPRVTDIRQRIPNRGGSPQKFGAASSSKRAFAGAGTAFGMGSQLSPEKARAALEKNETERTSLPPIFFPRPSNWVSPTVTLDVLSHPTKSLVQSESIDTISGIGSTSGIPFQPSPNRDTLPVDNSTKHLTPLVTVAHIDEDKLAPKNDFMLVSSEDLSQSRKGVASTAIATGDNVGPQHCPSGINVPLAEVSTEIALLSMTASSNELNGNNTSPCADTILSKSNTSMCGKGAGHGIASQPCFSGTGEFSSSSMHCSGENSSDGGKFRKIMDADSEDKDATVGSMTGDVIGSDKKELNELGLAEKLDDPMSFNKDSCLTESKNKVTIDGLVRADGGSPACFNGIPVPVETSMTEKTNLSSIVGFPEKPLDEANPTQKLNAASNSSKGLTQLKDDIKITADDILKGHAVHSEATTVDNTPLSDPVSSVTEEACAALVKNGTERTSLPPIFFPKPSSWVSPTINWDVIPSSGKNTLGRGRSAHDLEVTSSPNRGLLLSNNKSATRIGSGVATRSQSRLNGITMPLEPNMTGVFSPKSKKERRKKKNATVLGSGLPAPAAEVIVPNTCLLPPVIEASAFDVGLEKEDANTPLETSMTDRVSLSLSVGSNVGPSPKTTVISTKKETKGTMFDSGMSAPASEASVPITLPPLGTEASAPAPGLGSIAVSDVVCAPKTKKRYKKKKCEVSVPGSSLPIPVIEKSVPVLGLLPVSEANIPLSGLFTPVVENHVEITGGDCFGNGAKGTLGSVRSSTEFEEEVANANSEMVDDVFQHSSIHVDNTSLKEMNDISVLSSSVGLEETESGQADMTIDCEKANSGFEINVILDKNEVPVSGMRSVIGVDLEAAQGIKTYENNAEVELFSGAASVSAGARKRKRKRKKKAMDHSLGLSSPSVVKIHENPVFGDIIIDGTENTSSTDNNLRQSEKHLSSTDMIEKVGAESVCSDTVSHGKIEAIKSLASVVDGCAEVPKVKKKNVFERLSGFPSPRVKQIHGGARIFDRLDNVVDTSLGTEKLDEENTTSSIGVENVNIHSLHGATALPAKSVPVEMLPNHVLTAADTPRVKKIKTIKKIKRITKKQKLPSSMSGLRGSQRDEMKNTGSCNDGVDADPICVKGQIESREGVSNIENSVEGRLPIHMGPDKDADKHSALENVVSDSFLEDPTFRNGYSSSSLGVAGNMNKSIKPLVTDDHRLQSALPGGFVELVKGNTGPISTDAAGACGREKSEDVAVQSLVQENYDSSSFDFQISGPIETSASKALENNTPPVKANPSSLSIPREEASGTSITNSNEEGIDSVPERNVSLDDQHSPCSDILNSQCTQCNVSSKKRCINCGPKSDPEDQTVHKMTLSSLSTWNQQSSSTLRPKVAETFERKNRQGPSAPKLASGRVSFSPPYIKNSASPSPTAGPRIWRRTTLPQKDTCLSTRQLQGEPLKKSQSASYIRKGNTLVRNCAPATTIPKLSGGLNTSSFPLNHVGRDASKNCISDCKVNISGPPNNLKTGLEMPRASTLSQNKKLPITSAKFNQAATPFTYKKAATHAGSSGNQNVANKDSETQELLDSGTSESSKIKAVTYVKCKSNQLVASSSTEVYDSSNAAENTSSPPHDQYYKKTMNQLLRGASSLGSHLTQVVPVPDDSSNSESQRASNASSLKSSRNLNKQKSDKDSLKPLKRSKLSLVWTAHGAKTDATSSLQRRKVYPYLLPWKRTSHWRNMKLDFISSKSSFTRISKKLLLSRNRDTVYTRSTGGFSLRKSKVLSIGGSNLKWSKSIENRSKKANEEATLAVAAVERKKREQKGAGCAVSSSKRRTQASRERIFRIGSVRYKMDASKRTLQRVPDEKSSCAVDHHAGKDAMKSLIPKRLLIDNDEYIRIGSGNQLVRDPKKLVRRLASEKVRWSLHTARLRLAKKQQYCQFFTRFGKCNKDDGRCPYIHDPSKIVVCTKFLKGLCTNTSCKLTHKVIPERMEDCSYFLQGLCTNESCPYRHVNVNANASVCEGFLRGYCASGDECRKKHTYVCPTFKSTGVCPEKQRCKLRHPTSRNKAKKQSQELKNARGRYFGSELNGTSDRGTSSSDKYFETKSGGEDFLGSEGKLADYIDLDVSEEEWLDTNDSVGKYTKFCDSEASDMESGELDDLIKPMRLISKTLADEK